MFLCTPFANRCLIYSNRALEVTLHSSSARRDSPRADSPDHRSVRNKEIKLIRIYYLGPRFSIRCPYLLEQVRIIEVFFFFFFF